MRNCHNRRSHEFDVDCQVLGRLYCIFVRLYYKRRIHKVVSNAYNSSKSVVLLFRGGETWKIPPWLSPGEFIAQSLVIQNS